MSNQILISSGAKLRDLDDVIIGTDGVLSSLAFNVANGVPKLDENGKILVSQLPNSVMEFKGVWNAATNTPTLANGTGNAGDVYLCNVAGTVDFGAGPITFAVGDYAVYTGTVWARSSGATGTVTSVGLSKDGDALAITGSPITTSGTINIGFTGTNLQYINGAGNLVTFPTIATEAQRLITEVYNETGATLAKGTIVYINGGHGNLPTVTKAIATGDATSAQTYGIVQNDIGNMNNGFVVVIGSLTDLDTQVYPEGTQLYLSGTTAGAWTSTKPYAPVHLVYVAIVTRSHPTQGVVEVSIQNGYEMDELHNVSAQNPSNNDILQYKTATNLWTKVAGTTSNIAEGSNLYFTDARARLAISLTTTGSTGAATYDNITGVLNIPNYVDQYVGTVTSVGLSAPTGFSVSGSPVTSSGTLALSFASGYSLPTNVKQSNWDDAYTWVAAFPTQTGNAGKFLTTDGSVLSWATVIAGVQSVTASTPLSSSGGANPNITIQVANTSQNGYLSSTDWNTFNGKQAGSTNLTSLAALTFASTSFVKMTAAGTFALDTNTYALASALSNYLPLAGGTLTGPVIFNSTTSHLGTASFGTGGPTAIDGTDGRIITNKFRLYNTTPATIYSDFTTAATTNRSIVVPDASGTLALTNNLAAYLPLIGGTLTGALEGTTALFRGPFTLNTTAFAVNWVGVAGFTATLTSITGQPYATYVFNNGYVGIGASTPVNRLQLGTLGATGYSGNDLAIGNGTNAFAIAQSDTNTYFNATKPYTFLVSNFLINSTIDAGFKLDVNGTGIFRNTLSGTNAIFSDRVNADSFNIPSTGGSISTSWTLLRDQYFTGDFGIYASTNLRLWIAPSGNTIIGGGSTDAGFKLDVIGTGRFSSSLTASSFISSSLGNANVFNSASSTTGWVQMAMNNTSGSAILGIESNTAGTTTSGSLAYATILRNYTNTSLQIATNNIVRVTILGGGFVGIGTATPTQPLVVNRTGGSNYLAVTGDNNAAYDIAAQYTNGTNSVYCGLMRGSTALTGAFTIYTDAPRLNVLSTGQVIIGSTTSVSGGGALQVQGNVNINGVFQINGTTIGGGGGSGVTGSGTTGYITKWTGSTSLGNSIMYETASGVGINTTSPTYTLDVNGSVGIRSTSYIFDTVLYSYNSTVGTYFGFGNNATGGRLFMSDGTTPLQLQAGGGPVLIGTTTNLGGGYRLQVNGSISMAYGGFFNFKGSSGAGDVLVDNSGSTLRVTGNFLVNGTVTSSGGFFDTSDARLKTLVEDNYLLSSIANIKAKLYKKDGRMELGYYAQDLENILPSAVKEGSDGFLSLSYAQVHTAKIAVIEDEVTVLKNRVSELEKQLNLN